MKAWITYAVGSAAIAAMLAGGVLLLLKERSKASEYACTSLETGFCENYRLMDENKFDSLLVEGVGPFVGRRMSTVDINGYERTLKAHPYVENAEVWMTPDGIIHARIDQKEAVARIRTGKESFYIDSRCKPFPLSGCYDAPVRVFEGEVSVEEGDLDAIGKFNAELDSNPNWKDRIDSVHVEKGAHFSFRVGDVSVNFGTWKNAGEKFSKLDAFVGQIASQDGNKKHVDLQYKGRIICK